MTWAMPALATLGRRQIVQRAVVSEQKPHIVFRSPSSLTEVCTIRSTSLSLLTSAIATQDLRPMPWISFATSSHPDLLASISLMHTSYPSFARRRAMLLPMPRDDPVTIAVRLLER